MTTQSFAADRLHNGFSPTEPLMAIIETISRRLAARRRFRTVRAELEGYAPDQLAELGIRDADIEFVAEDAACR